jgi:hypothetical protein
MFKDELLESETPTAFFLDTHQDKIKEALPELNIDENQTDLVLKIVSGATIHELTSLSNLMAQIHLPQEEPKPFIETLNTGIKAALLLIHLNAKEGMVNKALIIKDIMTPSCRTFSPLFKDYCQNLSKNDSTALAIQCRQTLSYLEFYETSTFIKMLAPDSLLYQSIKAEFYDAYALKDDAFSTLSNMKENVYDFKDDTLASLKTSSETLLPGLRSYLPSFSLFKQTKDSETQTEDVLQESTITTKVN